MYGTLTLNDGTEITGYYIETETRLFLYMFGYDLTTLFNILSESDKTSVIRMNRNGQESQVSGYNHLYCISEERNGMITAGLKKVTEDG